MFYQACACAIVYCPDLLLGQPAAGLGSALAFLWQPGGVGGLSVGRDCKLLELQVAGREDTGGSVQ